MLLVGDFKGLEWNTCVYLSQDTLAIWELNEGLVDPHAENQDVLGLPSRLIAKKFLFRMIYGGSASTFAYDPEFTAVSESPKFWQKVIDKFYTKYSEVQQWHEALMSTVQRTGMLVLPTGRFFKFSATRRNGEFFWPRTTILNYPVQALGADLMILARVLLADRIQNLKLKTIIIGSVHDSIICDCPEDELECVDRLFYEVWEEIPKEFERRFKKVYNVICRVETKHGPTWGSVKNANQN